MMCNINIYYMEKFFRKFQKVLDFFRKMVTIYISTHELRVLKRKKMIIISGGIYNDT